MPFLKGFVRELRDRKPGMMTLVAVAISVAYFYSAATVFGLEGMPFFWELATLIDIMLLGHWIEMRSVGEASKALESLAEADAVAGAPPERRRQHDRRAARAAAAGRRRRGQAGREGAGRRRCARGRLGGRRVDAHRRVGSGRRSRRATRSSAAP